MKLSLTLGAAAAAALSLTGAALADNPPVPFPAPHTGPVFVAAQTVAMNGAMSNYFAPGATVVFRAYAVDTKAKTLVAAKNVKFFYVAIPNEPNVKLTYDPTAPGASKGMPWTGQWTVPAGYASGLVPFKILIKLNTKRTGQFVQMPVSSAGLTISASSPPIFGPGASGGEPGLTANGKVELALYADTVNGTHPLGAAPRAAGCSQTNVFKRGEQVVFRIWGNDLATGDVLSSDNVKDAHVSIPGQPDLTLNWGAHGATGSKVNFWSNAWNLPSDYPLGQVTAHIVFTTESGETGSYDHVLNIIP
jgi:hypothetical protein